MGKKAWLSIGVLTLAAALLMLLTVRALQDEEPVRSDATGGFIKHRPLAVHLLALKRPPVRLTLSQGCYQVDGLIAVWPERAGVSENGREVILEQNGQRLELLVDEPLPEPGVSGGVLKASEVADYVDESSYAAILQCLQVAGPKSQSLWVVN